MNVGSGEEISIKELVGKIAATVGFTGRIVWDTSKPNGQPRRKLETSRAEERFGFRATTGFDEGLRRTVDAYLENRQQVAGALTYLRSTAAYSVRTPANIHRR